MSQTVTGGAGLYGAWQAGVTASASTKHVDLTGLEPGWYDVEVTIWNGGTTGVKGTDDKNFQLMSDAVTADTLAAQVLIPVNPFVIASTNPPWPTFKTRVYANSEIAVESIGNGTSGSTWTTVIQAALAQISDTSV